MTLLKCEDYVVLVITLVVSLGIGLYYSYKDGKTRTTRQFIFGDGNLAMVPVALSLMVSYQSGILMLGVPAEGYMYGMQWIWSKVGQFLGHMVALYFLITPQRLLNITTINEYIELRYGSHRLRMCSTIMSILISVNYLGTVAFVPAITLEIVADIPKWLSLIGLMGVVIVYTIIGGFKAVVWTDVFQSCLMFGGMFAILIKATMDSGGIATTWNTISEKGRINMFNFDPDPTLRQSFWSLFVGGTIAALQLPFSQPTLQRIKATSTVESATRMFFMAAVLTLFISMLAVLEGAVMFAYYDIKGCDPLVAGQVTNPNQLIARMVTDIFKDIPCLPGLFLAAVFSASLSTMSSELSGISALVWEDLVKPHTKPMSNLRATLITRGSVLVFGCLALVIAFAVNGIEGPISEIIDTTEPCIFGAIIALFVLGWFVPWATASGAFAGGLVSVLLVGWISIGKLTSSGVRRNPILEPASTDMCPFVNNSIATNTTGYSFVSNTTEADTTAIFPGPQGIDVLYSLSYKWLMPLAIIVAIIVGSIISYIQERRPVDASLVVPECDYLCVRLPDRIREKLSGFNVHNEMVNDDATRNVMVPMIDISSPDVERSTPNAMGGQRRSGKPTRLSLMRPGFDSWRRK